MSGLFGTISTSLRALLAQQAGVETASQNIANINTPGYSRRRVIMQEDASWSGSQLDPGRGVEITNIESLRDRVLERRIQSEVHDQSRNDAIVQTMRSVELLFSSSDKGIGASISNFFSTLQVLSSSPTDRTQRFAVLMAAQNLASTFHSYAAELSSAQRQVETQISQSVQEVNRISAQIAEINAQVRGGHALGADSGAAEDQRGVLMRQLSALIDFTTIDDSNGLTLTTSDGAALVTSDQAYELSLSQASDGSMQIFAGDRDITGSIEGGKLGGLLSVCDHQLPTLESQIDQLAYAFASRVNEVSGSGFDLNADPGVDLFTVSATSAGAAQSLCVAISDPSLVAASSDGAPGDNGNLRSLLNVETDPLLDGLSPIDAYAQIVFRVGSSITDAGSEADAAQLVIQQLDGQRAAVSGVSLDEEAADLIRFQRAYQAAARVIDVTNQLLDTVINLGR